MRCRLARSGSPAVEGDAAFANGVVFKGEAVVKNTGSALKTLAAGTWAAVVELCVAVLRYRGLAS